jgi:glycosyltransferase involved in cell wall biosynthesis
MKRVVIIAGIFYPKPSPTGNCARQYSDLLKKHYDVSVVFIQSGLKRIDAEKIDGLTLFALFNFRMYLENYLGYCLGKTKFGILKNAYKTLIFIIKAIGRIQTYILWPNNLRWFYKKAYEKLEELNKESNIDCIFTINSPFSAHLAGNKYKELHKGVRWMTFTVDPFSTAVNNKRSFLFSKIKSAINQKAEKLIYNWADIYLVSAEVYSTSKHLFGAAMGKTFVLPYIIPKQKICNEEYFPKDKTNLLFAGRFYYSIRNPEYFLKTFLATPDNNLLLHLYSQSDCEDIIEKYVKKSNGRIIRHPTVGTDEIQKIMTSADILINIGNSIPAFKPSKTFEYISTGKPIVHFYQNNLVDETLLKYPISLQIQQRDECLFENSRRLLEFCISKKGQRITDDQINSLYPQHSSKKIQDLLFCSIET